MNPELERTIKEQIQKLPQEVKNLISNVGIWDKILNVGSKNRLNEKQARILLIETSLILFGLTNPEDLFYQLKEQLKVAENTIISVIKEVDEKIIGNLKKILIDTYNKNVEVEENKIKENVKNKNTNWQQNVDFALSGGDYSVFMEDRQKTPARNASSIADAGGDKLLGTSNILETKSRLLE